MADAIYTVVLDVTDNGCIDTGWRLHQGDYGESQVVVKVVNNGVNLFDASILPQITFKRSDGISIVGEMFIEDSTYKYNFVGNELEVPGFVLMDVKLIDSQGRTSTAASRFIVLPNTEGDTQEGSHTYINSGLVSELRENVQIAVESAATSVEEALVSEGWANGEQNGVPVPSTSPYYHNNSKYWSEQSNPTRFSSLSDVNFGTLEDGDIPVYDATSQKWKNEVGVSAESKSATITSGAAKFDTRTGGILGSCKITLLPVQSGSGTPSPDNVRLITGHPSVEVDVTDADSNTTQYTEALGQTVYGGSVDVVSGVLTVTHGYKDMGSLSWTTPSATYQYFQATVSDMVATYTTITSNGHFMCSNYGYAQITGNNTNEGMCLSGNYLRVRDNNYATAAAFTTAMSGVQFVYELATPITIQLTPQQIETLIGQNTVSVPLDGQSLDSLTYREVLAWDDVERAVSVKLDLSSVAPIEYTDKASQSYNQKQLFIKDNKLCQALASISSGASFTENTNFKYTTLAEIIEPLIP